MDASFASDGTKAWVVAGKNGEQLDPEATAQVITAATLKPTDRTVKVVVKTKEPDLTTEEAKDMGIQDKLSSYTTTYSGPTARQINVKLATKYATDVLLAPGRGVQLRQADRPAHRGPRLATGSRHRRAPTSSRTFWAAASARSRRPCSTQQARQGSRSPSAATTRSTSPTIPRAGTRR